MKNYLVRFRQYDKFRNLMVISYSIFTEAQVEEFKKSISVYFTEFNSALILEGVGNEILYNLGKTENEVLSKFTFTEINQSELEMINKLFFNDWVEADITPLMILNYFN